MVALSARQCDRDSLPQRSSAPDRSAPALRKQNRRQPLSAIDGGLVGRAPGLEQLHQLFARPVVVPFAIALDDLEQVIDCLLTAPLCIQREREIETGLVVERVRRDFLLEVGDRSDRLRLLAQLQRRAGGTDGGGVVWRLPSAGAPPSRGRPHPPSPPRGRFVCVAPPFRPKNPPGRVGFWFPRLRF